MVANARQRNKSKEYKMTDEDIKELKKPLLNDKSIAEDEDEEDSVSDENEDDEYHQESDEENEECCLNYDIIRKNLIKDHIEDITNKYAKIEKIPDSKKDDLP